MGESAEVVNNQLKNEPAKKILLNTDKDYINEAERLITKKKYKEASQLVLKALSFNKLETESQALINQHLVTCLQSLATEKDCEEIIANIPLPQSSAFFSKLLALGSFNNFKSKANIIELLISHLKTINDNLINSNNFESDHKTLIELIHLIINSTHSFDTKKLLYILPKEELALLGHSLIHSLVDSDKEEAQKYKEKIDSVSSEFVLFLSEENLQETYDEFLSNNKKLANNVTLQLFEQPIASNEDKIRKVIKVLNSREYLDFNDHPFKQDFIKNCLLLLKEEDYEEELFGELLTAASSILTEQQFTPILSNILFNVPDKLDGVLAWLEKEGNSQYLIDLFLHGYQLNDRIKPLLLEKLREENYPILVKLSLGLTFVAIADNYNLEKVEQHEVIALHKEGLNLELFDNQYFNYIKSFELIIENLSSRINSSNSINKAIESVHKNLQDLDLLNQWYVHSSIFLKLATHPSKQLALIAFLKKNHLISAREEGKSKKFYHFLLDSTLQLLNDEALKTIELNPLLEGYNSDELFTLLKKGNEINSNIHHIRVLLSKIEKLPSEEIKDILLKDNEIPQQFISELLTYLNSKDLTSLITSLHECKNSLNFNELTYERTLIELCQRLKEKSSQPEDQLHTLVNTEFLNKGIGFDLLRSPARFENLCQFKSSSIRYGADFIWSLSSYDTKKEKELENRIIKLLRSKEYSSSDIDEVAFNLLTKFKDNSALYTLFCNLYSASGKFVAIDGNEESKNSEENYSALKKAIFKYLSPETVYDDNKFWELLYKLPTNKKIKDAVNVEIAKKVTQLNNPSLGAKYLSCIEDIEGTNVEAWKWDDESLINLLIHSGSSLYASNWQLIARYIDSKYETITEKEPFINKLIDAVSSEQLTHFNKKHIQKLAAELILSFKNFDDILKELKRPRLQFLVKYIPLHDSQEKFVIQKWLELLNKSGKLNSETAASLLQRATLNLPPQTSYEILTDIYSNHLFPTSKSLCDLFNAISTDFKNCNQHYISLLQVVRTKDSKFKRDFLVGILNAHQNQENNPILLPVIIQVLIELEELSPRNYSDNQLTEQLFKLINSLYSSAEKDGNELIPREIEQRVNNIVQFFYTKDNTWINKLCEQPQFIQYLDSYLQNNEKNNAHKPDKNLIFNLLTRHGVIGSSLDIKLREKAAFTNFITAVLSNNAVQINSDNFYNLYDSLTSKEKLAIELLEKDIFSEINNQAILTSSHALTTEQLYEAFKKSNNQRHYVDIFFLHPSAVLKLSPEQLNEIVTHVDSEKQILNILNGMTSAKNKQLFVTTLLNHIDTAHPPIKEWTDKHFQSKEAYAIFFNYITSSSPFYTEINQLIDKQDSYFKSYYKIMIQNFFREPTLDFYIQPDSILYSHLRSSFHSPKENIGCHPKLFEQLSTSDKEECLRIQSQHANDIDAFIDLFTPFGRPENIEIKNRLLISACWLDRSPLLSILFQIKKDYDDGSESFKLFFEESTLYKQFTPFFTKIEKPISVELYNHLYKALKDYLQSVEKQKEEEKYSAIKDSLNSHFNSINSKIQKYEGKLKLMEEYAPQDMYYLFDPNKYFSKIKRPESPYNINLPNDKLEVMSTASEEQEKYKRYQYGDSHHNPEWFIASYLNENPKLDQQTVKFICTEIITNQKVRSQTNDSALIQLFSGLNPENSRSIYQKTQIKLKSLVSCMTFLNEELMACDSLFDAIEVLGRKLELDQIYFLQRQAISENAQQLANICRLTAHAIENNLSKEQLFNTVLPANHYHKGQKKYHDEMIWVKQDIDKLSTHQYQLQGYLNILLEKSFSFNVKLNKTSLEALAKISNFNHLHIDNLVKLFNSYTNIFEGDNNPDAFELYRVAFFNFLNSLDFYERSQFINKIDQKLLYDIITSSILALSKENSSPVAIQTIDLLLDISLHNNDRNDELVKFIQEKLDKDKAFYFDSALNAMKSEALNSEPTSLNQHTFKGVWIQRLLMNPKGFMNLLAPEIQALIERYRMSSRILKKDELDTWTIANKDRLKKLYHDVKIYDERIASEESDGFNYLKNRNKALEEIERIEKKQQQILYFKADECIQEMFKQLQQTINELKKFSIGQIDSLSVEFASIKKEEAGEVAYHAEKLLSQFQAQELTNAKTGIYASFMDSVYKNFLEKKGDLETEFNSFWHYVSRLTKQNSSITLDLMSKTQISEGQSVYNSKGDIIGKVNANKLIELPNSNQLLAYHINAHIGMPLYDAKGQQVGNLNPNGSLCAQNNFTGEATANIIRHVSLEKLKKIPIFDAVVRDVIAEGQLSNVLDSFGFLSFLCQDGEEKSDWVKQQFLIMISKEQPELSKQDCDSLCANYKLEEIYHILDKYPKNETLFNFHEAILFNENLKQIIISDGEAKLLYFTKLKQANFSNTQLEKLYILQTSKEMKQLVLTNLLNNKEYIKSQGKISIIEKTKDDSMTESSRLLLTAACVELEHLPADILTHLEEEPAAELLLSLKTYKDANQEQFNYLFSKIKDQTSLVKYFLVNNLSLPLFEQGFLKFYAQNSNIMWEAAAKLEGKNKSLLLRRLLKAPDIMQAIVNDLSDNKEIQKGWLASITDSMRGKATSLNDLFTKDDIIFAINLYIDGHNTSPEYLAFLSNLVKEKLTGIILLDEQNNVSVSLSDSDLETIFKLNEDETFRETHDEYLLTSYHLDKLLKRAALLKNTSLFYRDNKLDLDNARRPINQNLLTNTKVNGVISRVVDYVQEIDWQDIYDGALEKGQNLLQMRWDTLPDGYQWSDIQSYTYDTIPQKTIEFFQQVCGSVKAIDLYLFNCESADSQVTKLINDYLNYYENNLPQIENLRSTIYLINNRRHVSGEIRQAIYEALETRPDLFLKDDEICYELYEYKKTALIENFGKQGKYDDVIELCNTLKIVHPHDQIIATAKKEALLEKKLSSMSWFVGIRKWWNRMRTYGWSGFFKPNSPTHVITCGEALTLPTIVPQSYKRAQESLPPREPTMLEKLKAYHDKCSSKDLEEIILMIKSFHNTNVTSPEEECLIRQRIEEISNDLKTRCTKDFSNPINQVVLNNSFLFMENRSKLISLYCDEGEPANIRLNALLNKMDEEQAEFQKLFTPEAMRVLKQVIANFRPNLQLSGDKEQPQPKTDKVDTKFNIALPCSVEVRKIEQPYQGIVAVL